MIRLELYNSTSVLYNILIEPDIPMKLVTVIKMCLNKICCEVHISKNRLRRFLFRMV
jgi:hypothetical protein